MTSTPLPVDRSPPTTAAFVIATAILAGLAGYFIGQGASIGVFSSGPASPESRKGKKKEDVKTLLGKKRHGVKVKAVEEDEDDDDYSDGDELSGSDSESEEEDEEWEEEEGGELATFEGNKEEVKLVLVVRTDLGMSKGKIAAQCSHATLACYKYYFSKSPDSPILKRWERGGQAKVALQCKSEDEMLLMQAQAVSLGLCARVIQDAGRTQIASGSRTVLGVLGPKSVVDQVTGHLKLL